MAHKYQVKYTSTANAAITGTAGTLQEAGTAIQALADANPANTDYDEFEIVTIFKPRVTVDVVDDNPPTK